MGEQVGASSLITFGSDGAGTQYLSPADIVKEKIKFFLMTNKGEIPHDPDYGADLIHFVHSPVDDYMVQMMENVIRLELTAVMPYVMVKYLEVGKNSNPGLLQLTLHYELQEGYEDWLTVTITGG